MDRSRVPALKMCRFTFDNNMACGNLPQMGVLPTHLPPMHRNFPG